MIVYILNIFFKIIKFDMLIIIFNYIIYNNFKKHIKSLTNFLCLIVMFNICMIIIIFKDVIRFT